MSLKVLGAAALLYALAHADSNANVHNKCNFDVKITPSQEGTDHGDVTIPAGGSKSWPASKNGGSAWCLKMYGPGATNPTQLEWSVWGANILSYDLSNIDMHADTTFLQYGMSLTSQDPTCKGANSNCKPAVCHPTKDPSNTPCQDAYNQPFDPRTLGASADYDIDMVLCTGQSGSSDSGSSSSSPPSQPQQPAPQSSTTLAKVPSPAPQPKSGGNPVQVGNNGNAYVGKAGDSNQQGGNVVTQYVANTAVVTQYVTQVARDAEPTEAAEPLRRRHIHHHGGHHDS